MHPRGARAASWGGGHPRQRGTWGTKGTGCDSLPSSPGGRPRSQGSWSVHPGRPGEAVEAWWLPLEPSGRQSLSKRKTEGRGAGGVGRKRRCVIFREGRGGAEEEEGVWAVIRKEGVVHWEGSIAVLWRPEERRRGLLIRLWPVTGTASFLAL